MPSWEMHPLECLESPGCPGEAPFRRRVYDRPMAEVTAFVLAGGKSIRMGVDKAFVQLDGRTLLAHALELARCLASDARIVGDVAKFRKFGPVVEDIFRNCGPL